MCSLLLTFLQSGSKTHLEPKAVFIFSWWFWAFQESRITSPVIVCMHNNNEYKDCRARDRFVSQAWRFSEVVFFVPDRSYLDCPTADGCVKCLPTNTTFIARKPSCVMSCSHVLSWTFLFHIWPTIKRNKNIGLLIHNLTIFRIMYRCF